MSYIDEALEREYNNRARVPDHTAIFERWRSASATYRLRADANLDVQYGPAERHRMDLFHAPASHGTVVFIHGGYWRSLDKSDFSFIAAPFVEIGLSVAAFNYRLCPDAGVVDIVADCRSAFAWLQANGQQFGMPVKKIALAGHSAGGHLVAMLYATNWPLLGIDPSCIVGGAALSAITDLRPLLKCSMNTDLHLNTVTATVISPINLPCTLPVPLHLAVGADESMAFVEQSRQLAQTWPANCRPPDEIAGCNHFTIVDNFVRPQSRAIQFIGDLFAT